MTNEQKRKAVLMHRNGKNSHEIYDSMPEAQADYGSYISFKRQLNKWCNKFDLDGEILEGANLQYQFAPFASTVRVNANGNVSEAWIKQKSVETAIAFEHWVTELIDRVRPVSDIYRPEGPPAPAMLEIPVFDLHLGVNKLADYADTLQRIDAAIWSRHWDTIVFVIGQDLLHNDDFRGRTSKGTPIETVDMTTAWTDAEAIYRPLIIDALAHADHVLVKYSAGNHDESMSWAFVKLLERLFPEAEFDTSLEERKAMLWQQCFLGWTHGDYNKSGPRDLAMQFIAEYPSYYAASAVREVHAGHLHGESGLDHGMMVRRLPTAAKVDGWAKKQGYVTSHRRFMLFIWEPSALSSILFV